MDKKYQIFISSTYTDLIEPRQKVRDAILSMMHFPIGMEMFSAADEEQWEIICETIDSSDYYVLIVGQRYGSVIESGDDAGISYTEKEFRYAREKKIPILAFMINDSAPVVKADVESDPDKAKKLEAFKKEVRTGRLIEWWSNPDELAAKVTAALHKQMDRKKRPGWVRGDSFDLEASHAEILELSKKVRELEKENAQLKAQVVEREPSLCIKFELDEPNDDDSEGEKDLKSHKELLLQNDENGIKIKLYQAYEDRYRNKYEPLDRSCLEAHLQAYVTDAALKEYNDSLPDECEIDEYVNLMTAYERFNRGGIAFRIDISNEGTAKATDVRTFVDFPEEFVVCDLYDAANFSEPKAPRLPKNPIDEAERKYEDAMIPATPIMINLGAAFLDDALKPIGFGNLPSLPPNLYGRNESIYHSSSIDGNCITMESRQIPHKDLDLFDGIYVVPREKGKFQIKVSLMCSEYIDPDEKYIDVEVV